MEEQTNILTNNSIEYDIKGVVAAAAIDLITQVYDVSCFKRRNHNKINNGKRKPNTNIIIAKAEKLLNTVRKCTTISGKT